ncbi:F-box domain containing protein, partial [Tanacetum coccineum]
EQKGNEDCLTPDVMDFITKMPDEILVNILSRLSLKQAMTIGILSPRWRFVWCSLNKLDFIGSTTLSKIDGKLCDLALANYINQVNSVIGSLRSHSSTMHYKKKCF